MGEYSLSDKAILVTGGTGSFGKSFVRSVLKRNPRKVIVFSRDELKQHEMRVGGFDDPRLRFFIGDVRDESRLRRAMHGVDVVVHAAALKQVPACEYNPLEAIMTNVLGGRCVIEAAIDCEVDRVLALSTDKAVNPVNLYGATKLCAEKLFVQSNAYASGTGTSLSCVRYGNVVGSRGSVLPLFLRKKELGETLTITDPRMTRFWLTLAQGVDFVTRCLLSMKGGEVFVPKIPSMKIVDLARAIAPDLPTEVIGIRPGEKLHELLISADEARQALDVPGMYVIQPAHPWWDDRHWEGDALPEGFQYASDTNPDWLSAEDLQRLVAERQGW